MTREVHEILPLPKLGVNSYFITANTGSPPLITPPYDVGTTQEIISEA